MRRDGGRDRPPQDGPVTGVRALVFDVSGPVVEWRSGVLAEARDVESRTGVRPDWAAVATTHVGRSVDLVRFADVRFADVRFDAVLSAQLAVSRLRPRADRAAGLPGWRRGSGLCGARTGGS